MEQFVASVQYGDWKGTAAADNADRDSIHDLLRGKGFLTEEEFCVGFEVYIGETHNGKAPEPFLSAFLFDKPSHETVAAEIQKTVGPLTFRRVKLRLSFDEFFALFKRFNLKLSVRGLGVDGREYVAYDG
jgi:hypothetical protein